MQNSYISRFTEYVSILVTLLPVFIGILRIKTLSREQRVLFLFSVVVLTTELCCYVLAKFRINNFFVLHIFTPLEFILLSAVYFCKVELKPVKVLLVIIAALFIFLEAADSFLIHNLQSLDSISAASESLLLMLYSLFFFFYLLRTLEYKNPFDNPLFWYNSGVLIYFSGSFFLFIFSNYMLHVSQGYFNDMWHINDLLNVTMNILFALALWKR
jgi:hypothetical protein